MDNKMSEPKKPLKYTKCVVYEYCKNKIQVVFMPPKYKCGEEFDTVCAYSKDEEHNIFLGVL